LCNIISIRKLFSNTFSFFAKPSSAFSPLHAFPQCLRGRKTENNEDLIPYFEDVLLGVEEGERRESTCRLERKMLSP